MKHESQSSQRQRSYRNRASFVTKQAQPVDARRTISSERGHRICFDQCLCHPCQGPGNPRTLSHSTGEFQANIALKGGTDPVPPAVGKGIEILPGMGVDESTLLIFFNREWYWMTGLHWPLVD